MTKDIIITIEGVVDNCTRLSSFEGRRAVNKDGTSNYPEVHITSQDAPLIKDHVKQGCNTLQGMLGRLVTDITFGDNTFTFTFTYDGRRTSLATLENMLTEAVASYVMSKWIDETKPDRVKFYSDMLNEMAIAITKALTFKSRPTLSNIDDDIHNDTENEEEVIV